MSIEVRIKKEDIDFILDLPEDMRVICAIMKPGEDLILEVETDQERPDEVVAEYSYTEEGVLYLSGLMEYQPKSL